MTARGARKTARLVAPLRGGRNGRAGRRQRVRRASGDPAKRYHQQCAAGALQRRAPRRACVSSGSGKPPPSARQQRCRCSSSRAAPPAGWRPTVPVHRRAPGMAPGRAGNARGHHRAPRRRPLMGEGGRQAQRHRAPHPHRRPLDAPGRPPSPPGTGTRRPSGRCSVTANATAAGPFPHPRRFVAVLKRPPGCLRPRRRWRAASGR